MSRESPPITDTTLPRDWENLSLILKAEGSGDIIYTEDEPTDTQIIINE